MSIMKHTFFTEKHTEKETQCLLRQAFARPNNRQVIRGREENTLIDLNKSKARQKLFKEIHTVIYFHIDNVLNLNSMQTFKNLNQNTSIINLSLIMKLIMFKYFDSSSSFKSNGYIVKFAINQSLYKSASLSVSECVCLFVP